MRAMLLKLPHVAETEAWSTYVLFWAADKSIGGKLFAMMNPVNETNGVITYAAGPERYAELLEREGVSPSVEFPRSRWVQAPSERKRVIEERKALLARCVPKKS